MSENGHIDELMKSILDSGQEEVPARIWDGISAGLDRAARRRNVVVMFRRIGVAAVAAAAAIIAGFFLNTNDDKYFIPESQEDMIAVIEEVKTDGAIEVSMIADAGKVAKVIVDYYVPVNNETVAPQLEETSLQMEQTSSTVEQTLPRTESASPSRPVSEPIYDNSSEWAEEKEAPRRRIRTSIVFSGIAGTNNPQGNNAQGPMKSPAIGKQYTKTTVEHTGTEATYGIPLSFGLGTKIHFTERWSLGIGLNYSMLTSQFNGKYIKVNDDGTEDLPIIDKISNTQHYVGIPINVYYDIMRRDFVNFYAYAGGTVEKCIGNNYTVLTTPAIYHREQVNGVQLSANVGIGVEFMLGRHLGLYVDPSLRYYFSNGQPKSIRSVQPLMLGFEMGLRFNL